MNGKKKVVAAGILLFAVVAGYFVMIKYNDHKRIEKVDHALENSAQSEELFAKKQRNLAETSKMENKLYHTILSLKVDQNEEITKITKEAQKLIEQQDQYLQEMEQHFDQAYSSIAVIKPLVKKMKGQKTENSTTTMLQLFEKRQQIYNSYCKDYKRLLALNKHLYEKLENKQYNEEELDKEVEQINQIYQNIKNQEQQFNQYTEKYNDEKMRYEQLTS